MSRAFRYCSLLLLGLFGGACTGDTLDSATELDGKVQTDGRVVSGRDATTSNDATTGPDAAIAAGDARADSSAAPQSLSVAVISDLNGSYGSKSYEDSVHNAVTAMIARGPDVVLSTGDMVAGQQSGLDYRGMWQAFHTAVSDPLKGASIPFAVTPGNHDASGYGTYKNERDIYVGEWNARKPDLTFVDDASYPLRYAFTMQDTLFVSLDDTTIGALGGTQMAWLDQVLTSNPAKVKIVFGHVPLYPFAPAKASEVIGDANLEQLLVRHEVDVFISGHHHAYYPGKRETLRLTSMPCIGAGSRSLYGADSVSKRGFVLLQIDGETITSLEAYANPSFDQAIARDTLPASVGSGAQLITRDDL